MTGRRPGWAKAPYDHALICYLPNRDRAGREFDVEPWETGALKLLGSLFGGATSYPARGSYRRSDAAGRVTDEGVMVEATRLVESFIREKDFTVGALESVGDFMKRFKSETDQETAAVVVDGEMYYL